MSTLNQPGVVARYPDVIDNEVVALCAPNGDDVFIHEKGRTGLWPPAHDEGRPRAWLVRHNCTSLLSL